MGQGRSFFFVFFFFYNGFRANWVFVELTRKEREGMLSGF